MKILMVSSFLPYPLVNGGNVRLYNLLKNLSSDYEITLICEKRNFQTDKDIEQVRKLCKKIITVDRKKQWSLRNILKSGFSLNPFLIVGHTSSEMRNKIKDELAKGNFDLIHAETSYIVQNLPKTSIPIILVEHNIEYSVYKKFVENSPFILRPLLSWDVQKLEEKEKSFWKKANVLVAVSNKEKKVMNADTVIPNGVDTKKFKALSPKLKFYEKEKRVLFIGDFKWLENRDAARWIIKEIWPELKSKIDLKLWVVGRKIPDSIKNLTKDPSIIFDENAPEDTESIYKKSFLLLSPIRIGGGTSFKILEAMASGVPVIATTLGAEGITTGNEILKGDTVDEIVEKMLRLFYEEDYYGKIAQSARELAENKYDWKKITKELEKVYDKAIKI